MFVVIINTDNTIEGKEVDGSLASLQAIVGGLIQPLNLTANETLWANEEGLLIGLPYNQIATDLLSQFYPGLALVGTVFLTGGTDEDGNTLSASQDHFEALKGLAESYARLAAV